MRKNKRVVPIVEKMVEICLKWLGHVWKQTVENPS